MLTTLMIKITMLSQDSRLKMAYRDFGYSETMVPTVGLSPLLFWLLQSDVSITKVEIRLVFSLERGFPLKKCPGASIPSLTDDFKCAKGRLKITLSLSRDAVESSTSPKVSAGRMWQSYRLLQHLDTDDVWQVQHLCDGFGLNPFQQSWCRTSKADWRSCCSWN